MQYTIRIEGTCMYSAIRTYCELVEYQYLYVFDFNVHNQMYILLLHMTASPSIPFQPFSAALQASHLSIECMYGG